MKLILLTVGLLFLIEANSQQLILPYFITNHARLNHQRMHWMSTEANENGETIMLQTDLYAFKYPKIKLIGEYLRHDGIDTQNSSSLKLKSNYYFPITRKLSTIFAGSVGLSHKQTTAFSYSGGLSVYTRNMVIGYHMFGETKDLAHSIQFKFEPLFFLKKKESKYQVLPYFSLQGNYTFNDKNLLNPCYNYAMASIELSRVNFSFGVHESNKQIHPTIGISLSKIGAFNFETYLLLNKGDIPGIQFSILYAKRNTKIRFIRPIPGGVSF